MFNRLQFLPATVRQQRQAMQCHQWRVQRGQAALDPADQQQRSQDQLRYVAVKQETAASASNDFGAHESLSIEDTDVVS